MRSITEMLRLQDCWRIGVRVCHMILEKENAHQTFTDISVLMYLHNNSRYLPSSSAHPSVLSSALRPVCKQHLW
jgi:hypothetical protein